MAGGINKVIVVGNLGADPEVRYGQTGTAVCKLRVAVTERRKDGDDWKDATEWVPVACFGKTAENAGQYLQKGRQVYVEGRLQTREYEKDGAKKWVTEVIADTVLFLGGGRGDSERPTTAASGSPSQARPTRPSGKAAAAHPVDDEMPF